MKNLLIKKNTLISRQNFTFKEAEGLGLTRAEFDEIKNPKSEIKKVDELKIKKIKATKKIVSFDEAEKKDINENY